MRRLSVRHTDFLRAKTASPAKDKRVLKRGRNCPRPLRPRVSFGFGWQKSNGRADTFVLKARFQVTPENAISKKVPIEDRTFLRGEFLA
jgi:hypothetical protein